MYAQWKAAGLWHRTYTAAELRTALADLIKTPLPVEKVPLLYWDPALEHKP